MLPGINTPFLASEFVVIELNVYMLKIMSPIRVKFIADIHERWSEGTGAWSHCSEIICIWSRFLLFLGAV